MNRLNKLKGLGFALVCLLLLAVAVYSGFQFLEATVFFEDEKGESGEYVSKTIERNGVKYFPKQDIETFLIIGVDEDGPMEQREVYEGGGMADALMVAVFDKSQEKVNVISLNRDTMAKIPVRGLDGRPAGSIEGQLALAYAYGDGMQLSCENTVNAVSNLLYGIDIDHYVSMNMDAIKILNDAVGGVSVQVSDDFSAVDPSITMGEMTLKGDQALTYIRARKDVGTQLNISRMERQSEYMKGFFTALRAAIANDDSGEFSVNTFNALAEYMVTDCSATVLSSTLDRYGEYELTEIQSPAGENVKGEEYMEFYLDESDFDALVLDTFFAAK